ncbi:MAG: M28 family peptidase [Bacteroidota bacterium]
MKYFFLSLLLISISISSAAQQADSVLVRQHLESIISTPSYRNFRNPDVLNQVAEYIYTQFSLYADSTFEQLYEVDGFPYKNVVAVFGPSEASTIVVGAHYDVCGDQDGADDNASGTVALLELARLLANQQLSHRFELVAYTLEEPPYFRSKNMGSYVHAQSLAQRNIEVYGMVCLEMLGYFQDEKKTQNYPLGLMSLFYGSKGNYITLVNKFEKGKFSRRFTRIFKQRANIRTKKITGPVWLEGIDFSDHLHYWNMGISALMITDTAFYRNKNYHEKSDTLETLDLGRMCQVIDAVLASLLQIKG